MLHRIRILRQLLYVAFLLLKNIAHQCTPLLVVQQVLRSTATAALAGLFIYGNDRRRQNNQQGPSQQYASASTNNHQNHLPLDWGFDLSRTVRDTSEFGSEGWTVIDDDEAMVVATERQSYQTIQAAFPPLSSATPPLPVNPTSVDTEFIERIRSQAEREEAQEAHRARQVELARQQILKEALQRRQQRLREKHLKCMEEQKKREKQKMEQEEIQQARAEIEAWREEQWEKLRILSESQQQKNLSNRSINVSCIKGEEDNRDTPSQDIDKGRSEDEVAAMKRMKAAAKRKRAKERKRAQKAGQIAVGEEKKKDAEEPKRPPNGVECAACGEAILGFGFERYERRFCSPKCARTATPKMKGECMEKTSVSQST